MVPFVIGVSGTIGNGTWCQLVAPVIDPKTIPQSAVTGGTQWGQFTCQQFDLAEYNVQAGTGVTAATVTFQELFADLATWVNLASPAPLSLTAAGASNGILNGPFLGLRMVVTGITGGTLSQVMLKASVRSL